MDVQTVVLSERLKELGVGFHFHSMRTVTRIEGRLEDLLDTMMEGCQVISPDFRYVYVNQAVCRQGHRTKAELLGRTMVEMYPGIEKTEMFSHLRRCMERREPQRMENEFTYPGGGVAWFELRMEPVKEGVLVLSFDITKRKEVDRAKDEFVSLASHQLRTPLGIAKWHLDALRRDGYLKDLPETARTYLAEVYKNNERVLGVVRDLLSVSRIDQGQVKDAPARVDVAALATETAKDMAGLAAEKGLSLRLLPSRVKLPPLTLDPLRLREAVENLISNALAYTPAPGEVTVALGKRGAMLTIDVRDTGIGISKEDQDKIFSRFYRSEEAAQRQPDGSGLGLYVVKSYVEGWGGKVVLHSKLGKGSLFSICLPLSLADRSDGTHPSASKKHPWKAQRKS